MNLKVKLFDVKFLEGLLRERRLISLESEQNCEWLECEFYLAVFADQEGLTRSFRVRYGYSGKRSIEDAEKWGGVLKAPCPRVRPRTVDTIKWVDEAS
jgi:hypothetical protein